VARGGVVVEALRYKPEGRGFDSVCFEERWCSDRCAWEATYLLCGWEAVRDGVVVPGWDGLALSGA
jgi:hypothetical protein